MLVSWNTTKRCNLYCKHCYRDASFEENLKDELTTAEAKEFISDVKKAGFKMLILSGGEPLLREDIFELASFGSNKGLYMCLGTNGTLIDDMNAKAIKSSGVKSVAISIDSTFSKIHDEFRGLSGAYHMSLRGIENCLKNDINVQINITISKFNFKEITPMLKFCESLGAKSVHVLFLVETGRGKDLSDVYLNTFEYEEAIREVLSFKSHMFIKPTCAPQAVVVAERMGVDIKSSRGCIAGISYCSVLSNGDVDICPYAEVTVGNIRENSFYEIWTENPTFKMLRRYENLKGRCKACGYNDRCGGCRARAFSKTGDFMQFDEYCLL